MNAAREAVMDCLELGAKEFVLCSGARNLELVSFIHCIQEIQTYHFPEERSAAFFTLGRSIKEKAPTVIVTTSGTAVAELLPAVIESFYQGIPIILLTADRPKRFLGTGAPQTIEQTNIFGSYAHNNINTWAADGPLHINVCLEEPSCSPFNDEQITLPDLTSSSKSVRSKNEIDSGTLELQNFLNNADNLFVLLGKIDDSIQDNIFNFIINNNLPVYAESTSGLREKLTSALPSDIKAKCVLRIGSVPSCRYWRELDNDKSVEVFSVTPNGLPGLSRSSKVVTDVNWTDLYYPFICETTHTYKSHAALEKLLSNYPKSELSWFRHISKSIPKNSLVFLGNSLPIREWEIAATRTDKNLKCYSNRGTNGIDGNVSTFLGLAHNNNKESWGIFGDLTAMYDLFAPWILQDLDNNIRIVIMNNAGGKIFSRIDAVNASSTPVKESIINNHCIGFESWALMWGIHYIKVKKPTDLNDIPNGPVIIEVIPNQESSEAIWNEL
ncbi:MAG: 2-succinyl-5-enolpyruvyl-6-hydroxy-3-cyclohexene-1-carboxylic-acid synthase [Verrucomicrobiota bacterium]|nr:2-succinyl-5-enolpyruvyl-6-hydroxy-3-cyclohexene-1-carboxylic-acid synthase [Verrucomicrobiota bacterium]